jgi:hypothetical protein
MSRYYLWYEDRGEYGKPVILLTRWRLKKLTEWDLFEGKPIKDWDDRNTAYYEKEGVAYDLLCTTMPVHVISGRLKETLDSLNLKGVQYLPLRVAKEGGGPRLENYYVLNVDHQRSCLDLKKSDYVLWGNERSDRRPNELRDLRKAVMIRSRIGEDKIFRLAEWQVHLVVEEQIKEAITKMKLTGSKFAQLETTE